MIDKEKLKKAKGDRQQNSGEEVEQVVDREFDSVLEDILQEIESEEPAEEIGTSENEVDVAKAAADEAQAPQDNEAPQEIEELEKLKDIVMQDTKQLTLSRLIPSRSRGQTKVNTNAGALSLVYSGNGKRTGVGDKEMNHLGYPSQLQFAFMDKSVVIAEEIPGNDNTFYPKLSGKKAIIYSAGLVEEIIERFNLDFTGRTSITFYDATYTEIEGRKVVVVRMDGN